MNETVGGMAGGGQGDPKVIGTTNDRDGDAVEPGAGGSGPDASAAGGSVATGAACPECGAGIGPADLFCEGCGAVVAVPGLTDGAGGPAGGLGTATPPNGVGRVPGDRGASGAATDPAATDPAAMDPAAGPVAPAAEGSAAEAGAAATTDQGTAAATTGPAGAAACRSCGGRVAADGYCETCGARAPRGRDHFDDRPSSWIAAVCDRGIRHGRNEDAMAVVMGHEIAHAVLRHGAQRMAQQRLSQIGQAAGAFSGMDPQQQQMVMAAMGYGYLLPYARKHESEADEVGLMLAAAACFDPREAVPLWERMGQGAGGQAPPEFASTHPSSETRIAHLQSLMPKALEFRARFCEEGPL